ncbi:YdcF family protein [Balneatrix alpica]|uniref:YdcF family protein n=1 Tax=Balneatrix alpica TaxID=75684 RepID=A0ABV5Z9M1_9GAMM|nr:YdcF family protein [Balneatrix alpica]
MDDLWFYLSKAFWFVSRPEHAGLLILLLGWWLLPRMARLGRWLVGLVVFTALPFSVWPLADYLLIPLEQRFPTLGVQQPWPEQVAGIIVLGGGEEAEMSAARGTVEFNWAAERYTSMLALMQRYPKVPILVSGASGNPLAEKISGARVVQQWLQESGITHPVFFEHQARNTWENASRLQSWREQYPGNWLLVTSAYHMPRAMGVFRQQGWQVLAMPVDYRAYPAGQQRINANLAENLFLLSVALREWVGLTAYYWGGRSSAWLPAP